MINPDQLNSDDGYGTLVVEEVASQQVAVFWQLRPDLASMLGSTMDQVKLATIDREKRTITVFPTNTLVGHRRFLKPKHEQVRSITVSGASLLYHGWSEDVEDVGGAFVSPSFAPGTPLAPEELAALPEPINAPMPRDEGDVVRVFQGLPPGFTKDFRYGLGLAKPYWPIVEAVEKLSKCTKIIIGRDGCTGIDDDKGVFRILFADFDAMRKAINRITRHGQNAARALKDTTAYNTLAKRIGETTVPVKRTSHQTRQLIADALEGKERLDVEDQGRIIEAVSTHLGTIVNANPELMSKLHADIELATLDRFVDSFRRAIGKKHNERWWQQFFALNPIALNLVFGCPVVTVQGQASVGGRRFSGKSDRIADFLLKNSVTNNVAIVEIKTPSTAILNKKPYRQSVYTPSTDLSGAIGQVLDQRRELQGNMAQFKENSRSYSLESYSIHGCVIIGMMPDDKDKQRALELWRGNSKEVGVVTYDELLEKIRQVRGYLQSPESNKVGDVGAMQYDDLPF